MIASLKRFKEQNSAYRLAPSIGEYLMQSAKCKMQNLRIQNLELSIKPTLAILHFAF
jgi:hypothetical protein